MKTFTVANPTAYRYYRLNITENNGAKGTHLAELALFVEKEHAKPAGCEVP